MGGSGEEHSMSASKIQRHLRGSPPDDIRTSAWRRAPAEKPPFTLADLRKAIPPHCFKRSLATSLSFLAVDLAIAALLLALISSLATEHHPALPLKPFSSLALWALYWALQGCVCTGLWVIAHECGHGAFAEQGWVNDSIGFVLHSLLLVPYFSWKYSHRRHHSNTGSLTRDEVFVPRTKEELSPLTEYLQHPLGRVAQIIITLTLGWPLYLTFNATGRKYSGMPNHFLPQSPIFNDRERLWVAVSDAGLIAVLGSLWYFASVTSFSWVAKVYLAPLMVVNFLLVLSTLLLHTHPSLPHYDDEEWDWLRGSLSTVDRDFGFLNRVVHNLTDTHVVHHLFPTMPHYHAQEATAAIKPILGEYYQSDSTPVAVALWRELRECVFVSPDPKQNGVYWYSKKLKQSIA